MPRSATGEPPLILCVITLSDAKRRAFRKCPVHRPGSFAKPIRARLGRLKSLSHALPAIPLSPRAIIARVSQTSPAARPRILPLFLILAGAIGFYASWELTIAKIQTLVSPDTNLSCDFSVLVQCGVNLESWQGAVFGFPNPLLGLGGFAAPIAVGVAMLAGARFARWFWMLFNLGVAGALGFVCWLIYQSIFNLGTLCPWCMVVWSVTIPLFWAVTFYNLSVGNIPVGERVRRFFTTAYGWVPLLTLVSYLVVAAIAQVRLDLIDNLF